MIKKYNFVNSANKELLAEILSKRDHQPRAAFLSSLAAVMVAAISLTMVFGSLSTGALPLEEPEQQASVSSVSDGNTLPPEEVTRVHTETKTETVTIYNDTPQLSEALLVSDTVSEELPAEGKSLFNQKQQIFQWQYKGEVFTFFVKDNTVYRRNESTGKTVVVFKGEKEVSLLCLNDRYLFFGAENIVTFDYVTYEYSKNIPYCYRVDLLTGDILRLFSYYSKDECDYPLKFIRFDGSDVVFSQQFELINRFVVHEDGSYEIYSDEINHYTDIKVDNNDWLYENYWLQMYDDFWLHLNDDNTLFGEYSSGGIYDLVDVGFSINDIESFGYEFNDTADAKGFIYNGYDDDSQQNAIFTFISFEARQSDTDKSLLMYYVKNPYYGYNVLDGGFIQVTLPDSSEMILKNQLFHDSLSISYGYNDDPLELSKLSIPVNFDKLTAATKSESKYYTLENGETLTLTYYPINYLHAATPDSAD